MIITRGKGSSKSEHFANVICEWFLVDGAFDVSVEAEAENLEEYLEVVEGSEVDLKSPLVL